MASTPDGIDWKQLALKYGLDGGIQAVPVSPEVRQDLLALVVYIQRQFEALKRERAELDGAKQTVMALAKRAPGQYLDVTTREIDALTDRDALIVEDLTTDDGASVKRFTFVSGNLIQA